MTRSVLRPHLRVSDERARLRTHRRAARGRRPDGRAVRRATPTSSCSTRAASVRTPTTSCTATLGQLKPMQGRATRTPDRRRRLPGPEGPRPGAHQGAARRRRVRHPQRAPRRRAARRRRAAAGPIAEILDGRDARRRRSFPSALPARREIAYAAWVTIQIGCDNSLRLLHRACGARRRDQPPVRRHRRRGRARWRPTASPRSRCSARTSTLRARSHTGRPSARRNRRASDRCSPSCSAPSARSTASAASGTPARTRRTCGPRRSRRWPRRRRCASTCTTRCSRAATACWPPCTAATRPSAISSELASLPSSHRRPGRVHRHHRRLPRRDRRRLRAHARGRRRRRVRLRLHVHLLAAARHRGGRRWSTASSSRPCAAERFERLRVVVERIGAGQAPRHASAASRRCSSKGPVKKDRAVLSRPHPPEQARALRGPTARCGPARTLTVEITDAAPHHLIGRARRGRRAAHPHARASPCSAR